MKKRGFLRGLKFIVIALAINGISFVGHAWCDVVKTGVEMKEEEFLAVGGEFLGGVQTGAGHSVQLREALIGLAGKWSMPRRGVTEMPEECTQMAGLACYFAPGAAGDARAPVFIGAKRRIEGNGGEAEARPANALVLKHRNESHTERQLAESALGSTGGPGVVMLKSPLDSRAVSTAEQGGLLLIGTRAGPCIGPGTRDNEGLSCLQWYWGLLERFPKLRIVVCFLWGEGDVPAAITEDADCASGLGNWINGLPAVRSEGGSRAGNYGVRVIAQKGGDLIQTLTDPNRAQAWVTWGERHVAVGGNAGAWHINQPVNNRAAQMLGRFIRERLRNTAADRDGFYNEVMGIPWTASGGRLLFHTW